MLTYKYSFLFLHDTKSSFWFIAGFPNYGLIVHIINVNANKCEFLEKIRMAILFEIKFHKLMPCVSHPVADLKNRGLRLIMNSISE